MSWLNQLGGMLQQYATGAGRAPEHADRDFEEAARVAPRESLADGLAESFRSQETPAFPQMLGQLFGQSGGHERASVLNTLLAAAGPGLLSGLFSRYGLSPDQRHVTPEQAEQLPGEAVQQAAAEVEKKDPSIVDRISEIYAGNPQLFKTLGGAALTVVLARMAQKQGAGWK